MTELVEAEADARLGVVLLTERLQRIVRGEPKVSLVEKPSKK